MQHSIFLYSLHDMQLNKPHRTHCCVSTATVVTRTLHNITFYLHTLSCYLDSDIAYVNAKFCVHIASTRIRKPGHLLLLYDWHVVATIRRVWVRFLVGQQIFPLPLWLDRFWCPTESFVFGAKAAGALSWPLIIYLLPKMKKSKELYLHYPCLIFTIFNALK